MVGSATIPPTCSTRPANLAELLSWCNGLFNLNIGLTLDLSCVFASFSAYDWFLLYTYLPFALVVLVCCTGYFQLLGKKSPSWSTALYYSVVFIFLTYCDWLFASFGP